MTLNNTNIRKQKTKKQKIIPAVVSPAKKLVEGRLVQPDLEAFGKYLKFLYDGGIREVILQGSTGEGFCMNPLWAHQFTEKACQMSDEFKKQYGEKLEVWVCVASPSVRDLHDRIIMLKQLPIKGFMLIPPVTTKPRAIDVLGMFKQVSKWTKMPLMIYNNPARFIFNIDEELYEQLLEIDNVTCIKECAAPNSPLWCKLRSMIDEKNIALAESGDSRKIELYSGDDDSWEQLAKDGLVDGCVSVVGNILPRAGALLSEDLSKESVISKSLLNSWEEMCGMFSIAPTPINVKTILENLGLMTSDTFYFMESASDEQKRLLLNLYERCSSDAKIKLD